MLRNRTCQCFHSLQRTMCLPPGIVRKQDLDELPSLLILRLGCLGCPLLAQLLQSALILPHQGCLQLLCLPDNLWLGQLLQETGFKKASQHSSLHCFWICLPGNLNVAPPQQYDLSQLLQGGGSSRTASQQYLLHCLINLPGWRPNLLQRFRTAVEGMPLLQRSMLELATQSSQEQKQTLMELYNCSS